MCVRACGWLFILSSHWFFLKRRQIKRSISDYTLSLRIFFHVEWWGEKIGIFIWFFFLTVCNLWQYQLFVHQWDRGFSFRSIVYLFFIYAVNIYTVYFLTCGRVVRGQRILIHVKMAEKLQVPKCSTRYEGGHRMTRGGHGHPWTPSCSAPVFILPETKNHMRPRSLFQEWSGQDGRAKFMS